jgi:cell division septum initiation protein DivIVA
MDILKLLNELERLIEDQKTLMGLTVNFHPDDYLDITNKIRASLPEEVKRASRVTAESDKIVDGAREAAEQTLEDATAEADEIIREARMNAERMLRDAEAQANKMTLSAESGAKQTLDDSRQRAEKMLTDAHQQSEKTLADAHQQSEMMVSQSEVVRLATAQAREIVAAAEYETQSLRHGADEYAHGVMTDLEKQVGELMATIQRGRSKLDQRVAAVPPPLAPAGNGSGRTPEMVGARRS